MKESHEQSNQNDTQNKNIVLTNNKSTTVTDSKEGRWTEQQNIKYCVFVFFNIAKFQCKKKRLFRLYKPLSKFVTTRTSEQCRSHHRKLLQRFKTPKNIVKNLEKQMKNFNLPQKIEQHKQKLEKILIPIKKSQRHSYQKPEDNAQNSLSQQKSQNNQIKELKTKCDIHSEFPVIPVPQLQTTSSFLQFKQEPSHCFNWNFYTPQFYWNYFYGQNIQNIFYNGS